MNNEISLGWRSATARRGKCLVLINHRQQSGRSCISGRVCHGSREARYAYLYPFTTPRRQQQLTLNPNRNLRSRRKRHGHRRPRLRETLSTKTPRHANHAVQDRQAGPPRLPRIRGVERGRADSDRQGATGGAVASVDG